MAPTLSSASSPGPPSKRKHRGRLIIGALAALSGLLLALAISQGTRTSKNGSDETSTPARPAAQRVAPPTPPRESPPALPATARAAPAAAPSEAPPSAPPTTTEAPSPKETHAEGPATAVPSRATAAQRVSPPRTPKKKARLFAEDDPLADQK